MRFNLRHCRHLVLCVLSALLLSCDPTAVRSVNIKVPGGRAEADEIVKKLGKAAEEHGFHKRMLGSRPEFAHYIASWTSKVSKDEEFTRLACDVAFDSEVNMLNIKIILFPGLGLPKSALALYEDAKAILAEGGYSYEVARR